MRKLIIRRHITNEIILKFAKYLEKEEKSPATIEKYTHDITELMMWLDGEAVTEERMIQWKEYLSKEAANSKASDAGSGAVKHLNPKTVNTKICAFNKFAEFMGWKGLHLKSVKIQREMFRNEKKELNKSEYKRLIKTAEKTLGVADALIIETIGATGMRVSELQFLTVEAVEAGQIKISLKGKVRTIIIQNKLKKKLLRYIKGNNIESGTVFINSKGNPISRQQIWEQMKEAARAAEIDGEKVFPHNLRHLFARMYYELTKNLVELASILGHSSIETTRLYLLTSEGNYQKTLNAMQLVR